MIADVRIYIDECGDQRYVVVSCGEDVWMRAGPLAADVDEKEELRKVTLAVFDAFRESDSKLLDHFGAEPAEAGGDG